MAKGTKKVGITGRYGPRYGVKIRKQIKEISRHRLKAQRCPECQHDAVKRVASGIWKCNHCKLKFAAAAYSIRTRSYKRDEAKLQTDKFVKEDAEAMGEEEDLEEALAPPKETEGESPVVPPEKAKTTPQKPKPKVRPMKVVKTDIPTREVPEPEKGE
jgi:large subunit ribosomal protein L37Ae